MNEREELLRALLTERFGARQAAAREAAHRSHDDDRTATQLPSERLRAAAESNRMRRNRP